MPSIRTVVIQTIQRLLRAGRDIATVASSALASIVSRSRTEPALRVSYRDTLVPTVLQEVHAAGAAEALTGQLLGNPFSIPDIPLIPGGPPGYTVDASFGAVVHPGQAPKVIYLRDHYELPPLAADVFRSAQETADEISARYDLPAIVLNEGDVTVLRIAQS